MSPTFHDDRVEFIHHSDADGWIEAVAAEMAQTLTGLPGAGRTGRALGPG